VDDILETPPCLYAPWQEAVLSQVTDRFFIQSQDSVAQVVEQFEACGQLQSLPVVLDKKPIGIIHLHSILSCPNNTDFHKTKVIDLMQAGVQEQLVVSSEVTVDALLQKVSSQELDLSNGYLIVADPAGQYIGRLVLSDIVKILATLQRQSTRYANPLTCLPGHVPTNEKLTELMQKKGLFVAAYCDVDGFKSYNDVYGYSRGDEVILYTADLLQSHLDPEQDFIGHIGGDDFVILFQSPDWFDRCDAIVHQCDEEASRFYSGAHQKARGVHALDRQRKMVFYPIFSISIGAVSVEPGKFHTHHEVMAAATEVKKRAMTTHGGSIYIDERTYRGDTTHQPIVWCN